LKKDKRKSTAARKSLDRARKTLSTKNTTIEKEVKQAARYVNSSSSTTKLDLCNKQAPHNSFSQTETLIPPSFAFSNPITSSFALINPTPQHPSPMPDAQMQSLHMQPSIPSKGDSLAPEINRDAAHDVEGDQSSREVDYFKKPYAVLTALKNSDTQGTTMIQN
jgi:hypothetical protein